ncbi:hypothetical protein B0T22DRAFT_385747 [Podospora appendiculata]|uniref:UBC core domain-containing protein n=1 Tax=Podospora appendiculata TaxID=314037 RepID=A0AAE0X0Q0_9PEZI|nr:hypothetical protein B0T22DRAFT_385747 [Podospora appendiculata]
MAKHPALRRRHLQDVAELQNAPYPNITLHVNDADLTKPCLVLTPGGWSPLHLSISIPLRYPLQPPWIKMNSNVRHPNVFDGYICASVLQTKGEHAYTPAYTLKGIAIQLLSFFSSDSVEQEAGRNGTPGGEIDLQYYREQSKRKASYECNKCGFGLGPAEEASANPVRRILRNSLALIRKPRPRARTTARVLTIDSLPGEVLLEILEYLEFEDLTMFAQSWTRISQLLISSDFIRTRELQCFVLKANYLEEKLGVGVKVNFEDGRHRQGKLESEFELLSHTAFHRYRIRTSIHGLDFDHWLPLPISQGHWRRVKDEAEDSLSAIGRDANRGSSSSVLYAFMTDIITRLNTDLEFRKERKNMASKNSSLRHPSEKAIESYFHLFHMLLCLATAGPAGDEIVQKTNKMISVFMSGGTNKKFTPNLGYLLVALLISDIDPTKELMEAIVTEAITRNVVWMLDRRGAGMAELAYMEPDEVSEYRIKKTFEGSLTSYRILMFSELFRRTARPSPTKKSLPKLRDELFKHHGGPPPGIAAKLASEVRRLHEIDDFPSFFREMGLDVPTPAQLTANLRDTVKASMDKGYSKNGIRTDTLVNLRLARDSSVDREAVMKEMEKQGIEAVYPSSVELTWFFEKGNFFPKQRG